MVAVLSVVLLSVAAMGVDLGNAMNRKQLTQNSADFAALAGANGLPDTGTITVQAVADYLNDNQPGSDGSTEECNPNAGSTITPAMLQDGLDYNGEVTFPPNTTTPTIRVASPAARVQFGMATVMGFEDACVSSVATAALKSGKIGMAPYYATNACDQGPQVLKSDAGGPSIPFTVPTLYKDSDTNTSVLTDVDTNPSPGSIALVTDGSEGPVMTLTGTNLGGANIDAVGFFSSDQTEPPRVTPDLTTQTSGSLQVAIPNVVASYQDVWWVRVHNTDTDKWSARSEARPLLVGEVTLSCAPDSSSGNFGSIDIPHGGNDLDDLEANIRDGLREPTTLLPWPNISYPADNACDHDALGVISTDTLSKENTNCVQSVTGLKAKPVYDGLLGSGGKLLVNTTPACQALGRPTRGPFNENSDVLSCFLRDDITNSVGGPLKLSDVVSYNGTEPLFTQDIYDSPRFLLVPKLEHDPSGTKWMPISGFVPAFITDQPTGASKQYPLVTGATDNGLVVQNPQKLRAIRVFFFDIDSLPNMKDGAPLQDYIGSGPKKVTLVN